MDEYIKSITNGKTSATLDTYSSESIIKFDDLYRHCKQSLKLTFASDYNLLSYFDQKINLSTFNTSSSSYGYFFKEEDNPYDKYYVIFIQIQTIPKSYFFSITYEYKITFNYKKIEVVK